MQCSILDIMVVTNAYLHVCADCKNESMATALLSVFIHVNFVLICIPVSACFYCFVRYTCTYTCTCTSVVNVYPYVVQLIVNQLH